MRLKAEITSFAVLKKVVSIKISAENTGLSLITALEKLRGKTADIYLNELVFSAKIQSMNIRNDIDLLFHTDRNIRILKRLADLMDEDVTLAIEDEQDRDLKTLLAKGAETLLMSEADLLYKVTTFSKNGKDVGGKKNVYEVSDKQKPIVIDKISKLLKEVIVV